MKVNAVFDRLLDTLATMPRTVQAAYLEQVGTPAQRLVTDLESLRGQKLSYFSLVILRQGKGTRQALEVVEKAETYVPGRIFSTPSPSAWEGWDEGAGDETSVQVHMQRDAEDE